MKKALFAVVSFLAASVFAGPVELGVQAYMAQNGLDPALLNRRGSPAQLVTRGGETQIKWIRHKLRNIPAPDLGNLLPPEEAQAILDAWEASLDAGAQAAKSPRLKVLENEYFALLDALPGDPVPQTPSLQEAKALVDERLGVALAAKYRELLSGLDLELSRYSTTWWDDAARHDETDVPAEFLEALAMTDGEARQAQALSSSIALVVDDTGEVTGTARVLVSTDGVPVVVSDSASPVVPIEDQIAAFLQRLPAERARTRALQRSLAASIPTNAVLEDIEDLAAAFPRWEDNVGRQVHPGEFYTYDGTDVYRVIQGHVTQADWSPPLVPALFLYLPPAGPSGCPPFVQPTGAHDAYAIGDCVEFEGANYVSLIDANAYSPSAYPAGWELQE
ncbi:MAG TPA: hypothetical protein PLF13_14680 [candidate division Zixibacteria bacterium]|nr:hypothetical protein [candidate division Zixibacteria bacterium]